jgi:hypothetical protein
MSLREEGIMKKYTGGGKLGGGEMWMGYYRENFALVTT